MVGLAPGTEHLYRITKGGNLRRLGVPRGQRMRTLRHQVYLRDDFTCQICGRRSRYASLPFDGSQYLPDLQLGHLIAHRHGGLYVPENLQAECPPCNLKKGAR